MLPYIFNNIADALSVADTQIRLFGKPEVQGQRRMGVALARDTTVESAKRKAVSISEKISITV